MYLFKAYSHAGRVTNGVNVFSFFPACKTDLYSKQRPEVYGSSICPENPFLQHVCPTASGHMGQAFDPITQQSKHTGVRSMCRCASDSANIKTFHWSTRGNNRCFRSSWVWQSPENRLSMCFALESWTWASRRTVTISVDLHLSLFPAQSMKTNVKPCLTWKEI